MDLELLRKLVKLANNNSNEHEANSAARRVCKLIAENNFELIGGDAQSKPKFASRDAWDIVTDYMNRRQYGGGGASQYQQNQQQTTYGYGGSGYDPTGAQKEAWDRAYRQTEEARKKWEAERVKERAAYEKRRKEADEKYKKNSPFNPDNWDWTWHTDAQQKKRVVECLGGCGTIKQTEERFWTCDDCVKKTNQQKAGKCNICGAATMSEGVTICPTCVFQRY